MNTQSAVKFSSYFHPKLFHTLRGYTRQMFLADLTAGLTVGIVALPLAIAFAIASGVKPEAGIFTAIIAGFIISALGGSRVQIGGPTGAFIVIVYGILMQYGLANLLICTIMAGFMLLAMGALKLGSLIRFIPRPLVLGFTNGIAGRPRPGTGCAERYAEAECRLWSTWLVAGRPGNWRSRLRSL